MGCKSIPPRLRCHPEVTPDQTNSKAHGVFPDQITGSGFWFERTKVQRSLWSGDGMIRGHFRIGMV